MLINERSDGTDELFDEVLVLLQIARYIIMGLNIKFNNMYRPFF